MISIEVGSKPKLGFQTISYIHFMYICKLLIIRLYSTRILFILSIVVERNFILNGHKFLYRVIYLQCSQSYAEKNQFPISYSLSFVISHSIRIFVADYIYKFLRFSIHFIKTLKFKVLQIPSRNFMQFYQNIRDTILM